MFKKSINLCLYFFFAFHFIGVIQYSLLCSTTKCISTNLMMSLNITEEEVHEEEENNENGEVKFIHSVPLAYSVIFSPFISPFLFKESRYNSNAQKLPDPPPDQFV